jgi:hypothetical protein
LVQLFHDASSHGMVRVPVSVDDSPDSMNLLPL